MQNDGSYLISGEKWFCSNANAELILMTARYDSNSEGTKGLGLFLVPRNLPDGSRNHYSLRRLKENLVLGLWRARKSILIKHMDFTWDL